MLSGGRISQVLCLRLCVLILAALSSACANPEKAYPTGDPYELDRQIPIDAEPVVEQGRPVRLLDGLNHLVFSLPTKLILWNWSALDHRFPAESQRLLEEYLRFNRLHTVKVRHNQYAPVDEFRRLVRNRNTGAFYRYSLGVLSWTLYTLLPGRLFAGLPLIGAGDHFNPYTNTIHVYSSDPTILLHEGGHAKEYLSQRWKGSSTILPRLLPGIDLIQEAGASSDAIHYLACTGRREIELRAYRTLYPAYSTYVAGYVPGGPLVVLPVVAAGHVVGRIEQIRRENELRREDYQAGLSGVVGAESRLRCLTSTGHWDWNPPQRGEH